MCARVINWRRVFAAVVVLLVLLPAVTAQAVIIETVPVGNVGGTANAPDTPTGYGSVTYDYNIGKYEVTNAQYAEFLNAVDPSGSNPNGVYSVYMSVSYYLGGIGFDLSSPYGSKYAVISDRGNKPVNNVNFWEACRFANWLNNGQKTISEDPNVTEYGAYTLNNVQYPVNNTIARNPDCTWAITSENEWYKAAYYDPTLNGNTGGYWLYPTKGNSPPAAQAPSGTDTVNGSANYDNVVGDLTDVGAYFSKPSKSYCGTFDQGGNVWEWTESINGDYREVRGGAFSYASDSMSSSVRSTAGPTQNISQYGFRVVEVPEPSTFVLLVMDAMGLIFFGIRRRIIGVLIVIVAISAFGAAANFACAEGIPVAVIQASSDPASVNQLVTFDGTLSFHQDPLYSIVDWEWDFNNDSVYEQSGEIVTHSFAAIGNYPVKLRVADNSPVTMYATSTLTEIVGNYPSILHQPQDQTVMLGDTASFTVEASGSGEPLTYQWQKDNVDLQNDSEISGAYSSTLTLSNVDFADAGNYRVVCTNLSGYINSDLAMLTVVPEPSSFVLLGMGALGLAFCARRRRGAGTNSGNLVSHFIINGKIMKRLMIVLLALIVLVAARPSVAGIITGLIGVQGGPITYNPAIIVTPQSNNGGIPNPNPSPNQIQFGGISINGLVPIDLILAFQPSLGVTEYYLDFGSALNNTGVAWNGFRFTLGHGFGLGFMPMDQVPAGTYNGSFNFITVDNDPLPATSVFNLSSLDNDTIVFSGGGTLPNGSTGWATVSGLVPDPGLAWDFTVRLEPLTVPEPGTLVLLGIGGIGLLAYTWRRQIAMYRRFAFFVALACGLPLGAVSLANAETYAYQIAGTIESSSLDGVHADDAFTGWFAYASDMTWNGVYSGYDEYLKSPPSSPLGISFTINGLTFATLSDASVLLDISDNHPGGTSGTFYDDFLLLGTGTVQSTSANLYISLYDSSATALSSNQIPPSLILDAFDSDHLKINLFCSGVGNFTGNITSMTPVPEPSTFVLLVMGVAGLALYTRRSDLKSRLFVSLMLLPLFAAGVKFADAAPINIDSFIDSISSSVHASSSGQHTDSLSITGLNTTETAGGARYVYADASGMVPGEIWGTIESGKFHLLATGTSGPGYAGLNYGSILQSNPLNLNLGDSDWISFNFDPETRPTHDQGIFIDIYWNYESPTQYMEKSNSYSIPAETSIFQIPLADFTGLDLADVDAISIRLGLPGVPDGNIQEFALDSITADVPEPSALVLLGMGAFGLSLYGRRRR